MPDITFLCLIYFRFCRIAQPSGYNLAELDTFVELTEVALQRLNMALFPTAGSWFQVRFIRKPSRLTSSSIFWP